MASDERTEVTYDSTTVGATEAVTKAPAGFQSTPYDPDMETDPLIQQHITRDPDTKRVVFRAFPYLVGAIVEQLRAADGDDAPVLRSFPELSREDLRAAEHFFYRHAEEIKNYLD